MRTLNLTQGDPAWHAHRATARNASDAPAVLGCSPYTTRQQLLHARQTGLRQEPTADLQRRFDDGHAIEAAQRPGAAAIIGEPVYPVVGEQEVDGVLLSASFDGLTMAEDVAYECKTINDDLRACMPNPGTDDNDGRDLPKHYRVQCEQQLAVSGAERVLFVAANRDGSDVRRCWYYPDQALRAEVLAAWRQFDVDLAAYVPPTAAAVEKVVAEPVEALPAPVIQVTGQLALQDNFKVFEERLRLFLDTRLIRAPKTDQDFADLDQQIKAMKQARESLKAAGAQMLAQIAPVERATNQQKMLDKLLQENLSLAERLLKEEKERRRGEIVAGGIGALQQHITALNQRLGKPYMPAIPADFGGAVKGLKSLASMEDKVAVTLANAKIAANEAADRIDANLKALRDLAKDYAFLFADTATLVLKAPDDCRAQIEARIAAHKADQERRAAELAERERARIRQEEEARARAQAQREQQEREAAERRQREEAEARAEQQRRETAAPACASAAPAPHEPAPAPLQPANVLPMPTKAPPAGRPALKLGEIQKRIAPLSIDAAGLAALGFPVVKQEGASKLWHEHQFHGICAAIAQHAVAVANAQEAA